MSLWEWTARHLLGDLTVALTLILVYAFVVLVVWYGLFRR